MENYNINFGVISVWFILLSIILISFFRVLFNELLEEQKRRRHSRFKQTSVIKKLPKMWCDYSDETKWRIIYAHYKAAKS